MYRRSIIPLAAAVISTALLSGCVPPADPPGSSAVTPTRRDVLPTIPTITPTPLPTTEADSDATRDIVVHAFSMGQLESTADSGFRSAGSTEDAFPKGNAVLAVRIEIEGFVPGGSPDFTGLDLDQSYFEGSGELAVMDEVDGRAFATAHDLSWGPRPADEPWVLENGTTESFVAAWYVPPATPHINIVVTIPSQSVPLNLVVPVSNED